MNICTILLFAGFILLVDGLFGFIKRFGIPLPPNINAPIGFILIIISLYLNSIGLC